MRAKARTHGGHGTPGFLARISKGGWLALAAVGLVVLAGIVVLLLGSSAASEGVSFTGSGYPNGDTSNTRYVGGPIDSATVAKLETAWTLPLTAKSEYGSYSSSPIVAGGVIYSQDLDSNVQAISLKTGKVLWTQGLRSRPTRGRTASSSRAGSYMARPRRRPSR